jgi:hypothetical protein
MKENFKLKAKLLLCAVFIFWILKISALVAFGYFTSWQVAICLYLFVYFSGKSLDLPSLVELIYMAFPIKKGKNHNKKNSRD